MFRYVAFVWDDFDLAARERADLLAQRLRDFSPEWQLQVDARGARVFCAGVRPGSSEPRLLHGGCGVVLGTLFQRDVGSASGRPGSLSAAPSTGVAGSCRVPLALN